MALATEAVGGADSPGRKATLQLMAAFSDALFPGEHKSPGDMVSGKLLMDGFGGMTYADWTTQDIAAVSIRDFCIEQPNAVGGFYSSSSVSLNDGYIQALFYLGVPDLNTNPDYIQARKELGTASAQSQAAFEGLKAQFRAFKQVWPTENPGEAIPYKTVSTYAEAEEPAKWIDYQGTLENVKAAQAHVEAVTAHSSSNPVVAARANKPTGAELWTIPGTIGATLAGWKGGDGVPTGTITFSQDSGEYSKTVVAAGASGFFEEILFGGNGSHESVFQHSSTWSVSVSWEQYGTFPVHPPNAQYNFALIKANVHNEANWSAEYKAANGQPPLCAAPNALVEGVVQELKIMYGLSMKCTFDEATYHRVQQQYHTSVVVFGFFKIGANFSSTDVTWQDSGFSCEITQRGAGKLPFIVGLVSSALSS